MEYILIAIILVAAIAYGIRENFFKKLPPAKYAPSNKPSAPNSPPALKVVKPKKAPSKKPVTKKTTAKKPATKKTTTKK